MTVVVTAHQPNFLPWLGYFYKLSYSDIFIVLDDVQYTKGSYINRVNICANGNATRITMPVSPAKWDCKIRDVAIDPSRIRKKHLRTIEQAYSKSPYFDATFALLERAYDSGETDLATFNIGLIRAIAESLRLDIDIRLQSDMQVTGKNNELLAQLTQAVGGTVYVAGKGARSYSTGEDAIYQQYGVDLRYQQFAHPEYPQKSKEFVPGCSVIDLLMNNGAESSNYLLPQAEPPYTDN